MGLLFHLPAHQCFYTQRKALTHLESLEATHAYPQMTDNCEPRFGLGHFATRT